MLKIGSHVGMSGEEQFLGSVKEAVSYGANTFMVYTGAPQNTRRKKIEELRIPEGQAYAKEHGIQDIIVHAPYIINLGNTIKKETFTLAVDFLALELERTNQMGSSVLVLHPGAHVGAGEKEGIAQIIRGINAVLTRDTPVFLALECMAGKGTEIGKQFEQLREIYEGVQYSEKLRICFDTCHVHDSGYDIKQDFDGVIEQLDRMIGKEQIAVFHINDSKNPCGARKDRHENIGFGYIGFETLYKIVWDKRFEEVPKILETPYIVDETNQKRTFPPYQQEIAMLRKGKWIENLPELIRMGQRIE